MWFFTKVIGKTFLYSIAVGYLTMVSCVIYAGAKHMKQPVFVPILSVLIVVVPMAFVLTLIYYGYLRRTFRYVITDQRCIFTGGIFIRRQRSVPFHKITDVEINQNFFENWLGISSLKIFTPGTGSVGMPGFEKAEIVFVGLKDSEAPASIIQGMLKKFKATGE